MQLSYLLHAFFPRLLTPVTLLDPTSTIQTVIYIYIYITVSFNRKPRFLVSLLFPPFHHRSNDHDLARYAKSIFLRIIVHSIDPLIYRMIHGPIRGFIGSVIQRQRIQEIDQTFGEKKSARRNGSARVNGVNEHRLAWGHGFYRPRSPF